MSITWHKVSDGLPKKDGSYIIFAPSSDPKQPLIRQAWYDPNFGWSLLPAVWIDSISHWMELPGWPDDYSPEDVVFDE